MASPVSSRSAVDLKSDKSGRSTRQTFYQTSVIKRFSSLFRVGRKNSDKSTYSDEDEASPQGGQASPQGGEASPSAAQERAAAQDDSPAAMASVHTSASVRQAMMEMEVSLADAATDEQDVQPARTSPEPKPQGMTSLRGASMTSVTSMARQTSESTESGPEAVPPETKTSGRGVFSTTVEYGAQVSNVNERGADAVRSMGSELDGLIGMGRSASVSSESPRGTRSIKRKDSVHSALSQDSHYPPAGGGKALLDFLKRLDQDRKNIFDAEELRQLIEQTGLDNTEEKFQSRATDVAKRDAKRGLKVQWLERALKAYRLTSDTQLDETVDLSYQKGWSQFRRYIHEMIKSRWFERFVAFLCVVNVVLLVLSLDVKEEYFGSYSESIITSILVLEIATRWYGCAKYPRVFDLLLMWDTVLVSIEVVATLIHIMPQEGDDADEHEGKGVAYYFLAPTRTLRLVHLFRFKLFTMVSSMMKSFPRAVLSVIWLTPPVGIYCLAWAVVFRATFDHSLDDEGDVGDIARQFFSSLWRSLLTVEDVMFGSFQWSEQVTIPMYRSMSRSWTQNKTDHTLQFFVWLIFEFVTGVIMANLITALIIQECVRRATAEDEFRKRNRIVTEELNIDNIKEALKLLDEKGSGTIKKDCLDTLKKSAFVRSKLGIDEEDMASFLKALEVAEDGSAQVVDLFSVLVMMKGTTRSVEMMNFDLQTRRLRTEIREVTRRIQELEARVEAAAKSPVEHADIDPTPLEGLQELRLARIELMNVRDHVSQTEQKTSSAKERMKGNEAFTVSQVRKSLDLSKKLEELTETVKKVSDRYKVGSDFLRKTVEEVRAQVPERARQELADSIVEQLREGAENQVELVRRHVQKLRDKDTTKIGQSFFV